MLNENILQLGAVAIIFIFFLKEFFAYLKVRKNNNKNDKDKSELVFLNFKLDNHITTLTKEIFEIREEIREIRRDISDIKEKLIKLDKHLLN